MSVIYQFNSDIDNIVIILYATAPKRNGVMVLAVWLSVLHVSVYFAWRKDRRTSRTGARKFSLCANLMMIWLQSSANYWLWLPSLKPEKVSLSLPLSSKVYFKKKVVFFT